MQGFNMGRYHPPSPPSRPSRTSSSQPPTIRFELPFHTWCSHCPLPTLIPQGTRFNARKQKVGTYHTTPIWSFTIKHTICGGLLEIRTDPENTRYVVTSGGRPQEKGAPTHTSDPTGLIYDTPADLPPTSTSSSTSDSDPIRQSAFSLLERTITHRTALATNTHRLSTLTNLSARSWSDPAAKNSTLRAHFRATRKTLEASATTDNSITDRYSLSVDLLPESRQDFLRASLVEFGREEDDRKTLRRPMFEQGKEDEKGGRVMAGKAVGRSKSEVVASARKSAFIDEVLGNTRSSQDPFLTGKKDGDGIGSSSQGAILAGIKRKRRIKEDENTEEPRTAPESGSDVENENMMKKKVEEIEKSGNKSDETRKKALVSYASDSDSDAN